jgi:flavin-dependent dehydrogenase
VSDSQPIDVPAAAIDVPIAAAIDVPIAAAIDVIVAGGGPVGLAAALYARRAGLRVAVVEPRAAPIDKACGEGLMPAAVRALGDLGVQPHGRHFRGIRYVDPDATGVADFAGDDPSAHGLGVRRTVLHAALHAAAVAAGVEMVHASVDGVTQRAGGVEAAGLRARYLLAADGLHSPIREQLGLARPSRGRPRWGLRAHFATAPWADRVEVHWSPGAEAYVTPVADDLVGVAILTRRQAPFAAQLAEFPELAARLAGCPAQRVRGAGPLRQRASARVAGRVLLVGDAAGYVDALTGEGLSIGFSCARAAVDRICDGDLPRYERDYARITRRYRLITSTLLWATQYRPVRSRIVPTAERLPRVFQAAVRQLGT